MGGRDWARRAIPSENSGDSENTYVEDGLAECYRLARTPWKVLISLELRLTYLSKVIGAVRIALVRAKVRRSIPRTRTSIPRKAVSIANILRTCLRI